jgi:NAD(P)-dependent dehydrogenase (short-subunit alcohol dehydrogenase family)
MGLKMSGMLQGKVIGVTGGSSGIGRAVALASARHGAAAVIIGDLTPLPREGGVETSRLVEELDCRALYCETDVTSRTSINAMIEQASAFGGLDAMICNAGIGLEIDTVDISEEDFDRLIDVNLKGVLFTAQAASRQMRQYAKQGSIILISSMGGLKGSARTVGYCSTKGGVRLMAASLADGLGPCGIRVNAVCPGLIDTHLLRSSPTISQAAADMAKRMPLRRLGSANEVGDVIAWLSSDLSSYVTGISLPIDGGMTAII